MSALMLPFRTGSIRGWLLPQATLCAGKRIVRDAPEVSQGGNDVVIVQSPGLV